MSLKNKIIQYSKYFAVATLLVSYSCDQSETQEVTKIYNLVWSDDFNRTSATDSLPDSSKWTYNTGTGDNGWGNSELQYYTDRPENVVLKDGKLHITAIEETYAGSGYTSGRILTKELYQTTYGRFEAKIKLPWGQGLWPAFWLLGVDDNGEVNWPTTGEIDIMEYVGQEPTIVHGTIHGPGYSGGEGVTKSYSLTNDRFDTGFHVFGIEWGENYINYYVDDVLYNQITPADLPEGKKWVFNNDKEFFIILNLAVGGSFVGAPNSETVFPQTMEVDYVKVYQ